MFKNDKAKEGWKLLEDVPFDGKQFVPEFVEFLKPGEIGVKGEEMKRRAVKLNANRGQHDAEWLLEHQDQIPKESRSEFLIFPGTVWLYSGGHRFVPYLGWDGGERWYLDFTWLENGWVADSGRLVRSSE